MRNEGLIEIATQVDFLIEESANVCREQFLANETLREAFVRSIEVICEYVEHLLREGAIDESSVDWSDLARAGAQFRQATSENDYARLWELVQSHALTLQKEVARGLAERRS
jgi:uncharacterized protein with HEPN domain